MGNSYISPVTAAKELIQKYTITSAPVDVESICCEEGIRIISMDMHEIEDIAKKPIAGAIQKHPQFGYTILVNESDIAVRQRFTIAHELGHFFLHMDKDAQENKIITSFRMDSSPKERQANAFAANLLMPESLVRQEHARMVIPVSDSLADIFRVSKQAMRFRLDELELLYV
ncbi:ImmA/IrrE family metallo-endopeptidase [uncultured Oscillibacter sp.]|uniref:ImmA/IrrE family metallo-endopeptidase n=1 Tax=uncultured Oscillibacter sp. TaxID=876091 RepID=UPI0025CE4860|nr:ImmA/IrrE family metallo-endopeptidase [uncultured Oscillibacter sp.]